MQIVGCAVVALALLGASACRGGGPPPGPSATVTTLPPSTTTSLTAVEQEVEAAYLRSWEVYARAALELRTDLLNEAYDGAALETTRSDVERYRSANTPARFEVEHDYVIQLVDATTAEIRDTYVNHSVLLDASGRPIEADPNETIRELYRLRRTGEAWKVIAIEPF